jgi:hypothetical protein
MWQHAEVLVEHRSDRTARLVMQDDLTQPTVRRLPFNLENAPPSLPAESTQGTDTASLGSASAMTGMTDQANWTAT